MVHPRIYEHRLRQLLRRFPIVSILGTRQIGKSTLAKSALRNFDFVDLEDPRDLRRVQMDLLLVLSQSKRLVIDEAQRHPDLFPALRNHVDAFPKKSFVLLGSASPTLFHEISESLTGRVGFLELGPMSVFEDKADDLWIKGSFPRIHWGRPKPTPEEWYSAYLRTYLEQDIPTHGFRMRPQMLLRLLTMVAHGQGGVCNLTELGGSIGMNYHSVAHALDIFEGTYLLRRLSPYFVNLKKRLVKSPKIYIRDTGLLHALLEIPYSKRSLLRHPKAGASFETFCVDQLITHAKLSDPRTQAFFYRTQTGVEVDLLLQKGETIVPIEIKMSLVPPNPQNLEICMNDLGLKTGYVVILAQGMKQIKKGIFLCGLKDLIVHLTGIHNVGGIPQKHCR